MEGGQPVRPDWGRLRDVQRRLAEEAEQAVCAGLPPAAASTYGQHSTQLPELAGFKDLDPAGYGEPVFDEGQTRELCPLPA